MKKNLLLFLFSMLAAVMTTSADNLPAEFQWAHSVDGNTTAGDNAIDVKVSKDGYYYIASAFGSANNQTNNQTAATGVWFDGEQLKNGNDELIAGGLYTTGTSYNSNVLIQKVKRDGEVVWTGYTNKGDSYANDCQITATNDGGVLLVLKSRGWTEADGINNIMSYVDPTGKATVFTDEDNVKGEYRYQLLKLNANGSVEWRKEFAGKSTTPEGTKALNNMYIYGVAVDEENNIYLSGNFRTEITMQGRDSSTPVTLTPKNVTGWDGDSQKTVGDMFLVKLDSEGNYLNSLLAEGTATLAYLDRMVYNDGILYIDGRVTGDGTTLTLGGKEIKASSSYQTEFLVSVKTANLTVGYLNVLTSVANTQSRFVLQNKGTQYLNGKVYYTGLLNGSWNQGDKTLLTNHTSKQLKGFVLQVNPTSGKVENAIVRTDGGIGGFFGVYEGEKNIYAYGYDFNSGAIITPIMKSTFEAQEATTICKYGTVGIMVPPAVDGENFIMAHRGGKALTYTNTATFYGTDTSFSNLKCWGSVYYCYKMTDVLTGIDSTITENTSTTTDVYTINGIRVKANVSTAEATQGLAKGIYIINHKKVVIK